MDLILRCGGMVAAIEDRDGNLTIGELRLLLFLLDDDDDDDDDFSTGETGGGGGATFISP